MARSIFTKATCACGGMVRFAVSMAGGSLIARSVVGHRYVNMAGRSLSARSVVGLAYVSMAGRRDSARSVVGLPYVSMAGRSLGLGND